MSITRRHLLRAVPMLLAAPAIVRVASLMPVKSLPPELILRNPLFRELAEITHRAFVPRLFVQIYQTNPTTLALLRRAEHASVGL